eukprot:1009188-Rhodomonas_salina.6
MPGPDAAAGATRRGSATRSDVTRQGSSVSATWCATCLRIHSAASSSDLPFLLASGEPRKPDADQGPGASQHRQGCVRQDAHALPFQRRRGVGVRLFCYKRSNKFGELGIGKTSDQVKAAIGLRSRYAMSSTDTWRILGRYAMSGTACVAIRARSAVCGSDIACAGPPRRRSPRRSPRRSETRAAPSPIVLPCRYAMPGTHTG